MNNAIAADAAIEAPSVWVARQPILDRDGSIFGYELLFRNPGQQEATFGDGNVATARVLTHTLIDIGAETVVGEHLAFVNMPEDFLNGQLTVPLDPARYVLEVQEDAEPVREVVDGIEALREDGFRICLSHSASNVNTYDLLHLADLVKIDVPSLTADDLRREAESIRSLAQIRLIALRVETQEEYGYCRDLGFDYFQGYFFARPQIVEGRQIPGNDLTLLQLMSKVWQPEFDLGEIEELIAQDVSLSYKLLRFINSAAFVTRREIDTIHGAVVILGIRNLARWISMLTVGSLESSGNALTELALVRGRTCELIALGREHKHDAPIYFTAGLLSILDALTGMPMQDALQLLPLSPELNDALRERKGP
ncbi:MAG: HDOD domain-containing protein, partial [Pseudomonadota bacterium]|nr:HDOD domain-containing protein [Pseudomonadota bacterium]